MQIKVNLDQNIYEELKTSAKQHRRTLSAELNTILEEQLLRPGIQSIPVIPTPEPGIPTAPHTITATAGLSQPVDVKAPAQTFNTTNYDKKRFIGMEEDEEDKDNKENKPTNPFKEQIKIYMDTYDINPKDHTMATYKKLKEKFAKLDIETFDEIQHERE